jgi:hypothetical protein
VSRRRVLVAAFVLLEFSSPSRRIFIGSHSLPPSLVRRIGPSMVTLPMVSSFFSTCGCFLRGGRSPSGDLPALSLACGWPLGTNSSAPLDGGASRTLGLKILRVQGKGAEPTPGVGWASQPRPTGLGPPRPGSVAPSLPWVLMYLCTLPLPLALF